MLTADKFGSLIRLDYTRSIASSSNQNKSDFMISVSVIDRATRLESKMRRIVPTLALVVLLVGSSSFNFVSAADFSNLSLEEQILEIQQKCVFRRFFFLKILVQIVRFQTGGTVFNKKQTFGGDNSREPPTSAIRGDFVLGGKSAGSIAELIGKWSQHCRTKCLSRFRSV